MGPTLVDFAAEARARVRAGYYDVKRLPEFCPPRNPPSLVSSLAAPAATLPVIAEVKPASPTEGAMRGGADAGALARAFVEAGARGVSALAENARFGGSPENVIAATTAGAPVLFKDFVLAEEQLKCARRCGASAVLLILDLCEEESEKCADSLIARAHDFSLEVLLEVYDDAGFERALATDADLLGINARDLRKPGLPIDLGATAAVLANVEKDRPVVALSGVVERRDLVALRDAGADAALIGSVLMKAADPAAKLRELLK